MDKYATLYPKLKYFFSAYFHQDWKSFYDLRKEDSIYQVVVRDFKTNNPRETIEQASKELDKLLSLDLSETDLGEIIVHQLGANIHAPGTDLTYRQWAQAVLDNLRESL